MYVNAKMADDQDNVEYFKAFDLSCKREVKWRDGIESHNDPAAIYDKLRTNFSQVNKGDSATAGQPAPPQ